MQTETIDDISISPKTDEGGDSIEEESISTENVKNIQAKEDEKKHKAKTKAQMLLALLIVSFVLVIIALILAIVALVVAGNAANDAAGNPALNEGLSSTNPPWEVKLTGPLTDGSTSQDWEVDGTPTGDYEDGPITLWPTYNSDVLDCDGTNIKFHSSGWYNFQGSLAVWTNTETLLLDIQLAPTNGNPIGALSWSAPFAPSAVGVTQIYSDVPFQVSAYIPADTRWFIRGVVVGNGNVVVIGNDPLTYLRISKLS